MKSQDLKKLILSLNQDIVFDFDGENVCINPMSADDFQVGYGDTVRGFHAIDDLMNDQMFKGKSLSQIAETIDID